MAKKREDHERERAALEQRKLNNLERRWSSDPWVYGVLLVAVLLVIGSIAVLAAS